MRLFVSILYCSFFIHVAYAQDNATYKRMANEANSYLNAKSYQTAALSFEKLIALAGDESGYMERYNAACAWAQAGNKDNAFKQLFYLATAKKDDPKGYMTYAEVSHPIFYYGDPDLETLRTDKRWDELRLLLQKKKKPIVNTLDSIYVDDQLYRSKLNRVEEKYGRYSVELTKLWQQIKYHDSIDLVQIERIIRERGWLSADSVGKKGNATIFLVIQHANLKTQQKYLPIMRQAVKEKRAFGKDLALLEDRVALAEGKKQIYGSQVMRDSTGGYYLYHLAEPDSVDIRRRRIGLGPIAYYLKNWKLSWDVETYKKELAEKEKNNTKEIAVKH